MIWKILSIAGLCSLADPIQANALSEAILVRGKPGIYGMFHSSAAPFRKGVNCPSSNQILTFLANGLGDGQMSAVKVHLTLCDFCSAEAEFYKRFPDLREDEPGDTEIPRHLYQLAKALLSTQRDEMQDLDTLVMGGPDQGHRRH